MEGIESRSSGAPRLFALVLAVLALSSCEALLAPLYGRWNLADPARQPAITLYPTADGYVDNAPTCDFSGPLMAVYDSAWALLKFDLSGLTAYVVAAELRLKVETLSGSLGVSAYRIAQSWDLTTVSWSQASMTGFTDLAGSPPVLLESAETYYSLDVTEVLRSIPSGANYELLIRPNPAVGNWANLYSSRKAGAGPILLVYGPH